MLIKSNDPNKLLTFLDSNNIDIKLILNYQFEEMIYNSCSFNTSDGDRLQGVYYCWSLLMTACKYGSDNIIRYLITSNKTRPYIDIYTNCQLDPLSCCISLNQPKCLQLLLNYMHRMDCKDWQIKTQLY